MDDRDVLAQARGPGGQPALVQGENPPTRQVVEGGEGEDIREGEVCSGTEPSRVEGAGGDQPEAQPLAPFVIRRSEQEGTRQGGDGAQADQGVLLRLVGNTRGSHFMNCVEYVADKASKELLPPEANIARRIAEHGQKRGIIVRPIAQLNILSPPLILDRAQIDFLVDALRESAEAATADLVAEGYLD